MNRQPPNSPLFPYPPLSRSPPRAALKECVAPLEGAEYGRPSARGLAATTAVMSLLSPGDHVVAGDDLYGGSYRLFDKVLPRTGGLEFTFADTTDPSSVERALRPETKMQIGRASCRERV